MEAFNYAFAIFMFGCVITGVVWLGVQEAGREVNAWKSDEKKQRARRRREPESGGATS